MAILILKHNALTPYANLESAKVGIIEKMATAQQGELWSAEYFTAASEGIEETKGAILAFKGKNGIVTFTDSDNVSEEMKTSLADYYTKDEVDAAIDTIVKSAIGVVGGDGIVISGEGTEKTISTNVELEIKTIEGKEMIQLLDATDNSKVLAEVDASKFVVDGMLDSASIVTINDETELPEGVELPNGKYIKLTWNTDAGKSDTYVAVADLISEHKVVAGEDVAGEMVIVATNVVESTDENGIKVSTVNVTVDDTAVQSALDSKIGKEDVMLQFGGDTTYVLNRSTSETPVVLTGASWRVEFECDHNYFDINLKNSKGEVVTSYSGTVMYGTMGYMQHDNGILTSDVFENPSERQIDPNESYSIELVGRTHQYYEEQVTLTVKVKSNESQQVFNTEESIQYLNENKADKSLLDGVAEQVVSVEQQVNDKIGINDGMLSFTTSGGSKIETVSFEQYGRYEIKDLHGNWTILVNGDGGYTPGSITLSDPNRDGAQIFARSNYSTNVKFVCENGTIRAYGYDDNMGDYGEQGSLTEGSGLYYIEFNDKAFNGTIEIQGVTVETSLNTKESFEYININKVEKPFVEAQVSTKIDKSDIMLSYGDLTTQEMGLGGGYSFYTPFVSGSYWQFSTSVQTGGYPSFNLLNSNGDVIYNFYGEGPYHKNLELTNEGGNLVIKSGNDGYFDGGVSSIKIDSNEQYRLQALSGSIDNWVVITTLTNVTELNTNQSINYLNNNKANKNEVESAFTSVNNTLSSKIGVSDIMLSFSTLANEFTEELVCDGTSDSFGSLTAGGSSWVFDVMLSNYGICSLCKANGNIEVYRYDANGPMEKNIRFTSNNGRLIIDYGFQPIEMDIEIEHDYRIILHSNSTANVKLSYFNSTNYTTKTSIEYLNEQIQNNTSNKLGKFDTVLSVNDGETNTDYNVEGALDYLNSEIQALNIINCGVY